jgi:glycosyltransferase involved in cell wall biosynthesis
VAKLKIGILSYRSAPFGGGQGIYVKDISQALLSLGHSVDVISGDPYPQLYPNVKLIKLPGLNLFETFNFKDRLKKFLNNPKSLANIQEFISTLFGGFPEMRSFGKRVDKFLLDNNEYDIIIDNQSLSYGILSIQKRFPLIEIIHHPITMDLKHDLEANNKFLYRLSRKRWYSFLNMQKKVAPNIRKIITPSTNSKKDIVRDFKCNESNISVIHNGLDTNIFKPYENITRDKYRLISTASADTPLKGLSYTLRAISKLKNGGMDINLLVIGKMKKDGHTARLIKKLGISNNVTFKTNLTKEEISIEYARSSIAIVSSLYEGFGYPVIEAMSCAIPLIAANTSSIPELVGGHATLIEPKDSDSLVDSIKHVIGNYDDYDSMARKGRKHVIHHFNWNKISKEYEDIIIKNIRDFHNANI